MNIAVPASHIVENKIICHNPVGYPPKVARKSLAPRLDTLDGKTVYLVDCRFDDSIELLKQAAASATESAICSLFLTRAMATRS